MKLKNIYNVIFACLSCVVLFSEKIFAISCEDIGKINKFENHYYALVANKMTFNQAKLYAKINKGYLAIPNSMEENIFLQSMIGGGKMIWLGIYDKDFSNSYCYLNKNCKKDLTRFVDLKNQSIIFSNWDKYEPNNLVKKDDIVNGAQMVAPLGEHWVYLNGNNGKWGDIGNHIDNYNNPVKYKFLIEFEDKPKCYKDNDVEKNLYEIPRCTTKIFDDKINILKKAENFECKKDTNNNYYCPSALSLCGKQFDYQQSVSVEGLGTYNEYLNKEKKLYKTSPILIDKYFYLNKRIKSLSRINFAKCNKLIDDKKFSCASPNNIKYFYENKIYDFKKHPKEFKKISYPVKDSLKILELIYKSRNIFLEKVEIYKIKKLSCPVDFVYNEKDAICEKKILECPSGYEENGDNCKKTLQYTYYKYLCSKDYIPINKGGDCDGNINELIDTNNDGIKDSCNSEIPPINNCKKEKYVCKSNKDRPCVYVNKKWQCSPFKCYGKEDIEFISSIDENNNKDKSAWGEDGACLGQIYIFNGKDSRCRFDDVLFGLSGGGCCQKEKTMGGMVQCKEEEKELVLKNKKGLCLEIGKYCSKKLNLPFKKICIANIKTFCCFSTKLSKQIQIEGKKQLNISWGTPKKPNCSGFTPEQFQFLDFSKIDLSKAIDMPKVDSELLKENINNSINNLKNIYSN